MWWLGSTKGAVRTALSDVDAVAGRAGRRLDRVGAARRHRRPGGAPVDVEPWVALLPTLDPTTMGWRGRALLPRPGAHAVPLRLGRQRRNDGVGRRPDRRVLGAGRRTNGSGSSSWRRSRRDARRLLDVEAARLDEFLARRAHHQRVRLAADEARTPELRPARGRVGGREDRPILLPSAPVTPRRSSSP